MTTLFTDEAAFEAAAKYFRLPVLSVRPWSFGNTEIAPPPDHKRAIVSLRESRLQTESMAAEASAAVRHYLDADAKLLNATRAEALFQAGFYVGPGTFDLPAAGQNGVDQLRHEQQRVRQDALRFLDRYEDMIRIRMGTTIRLLRLRHIIESVSTGGPKDPTGPAGVFRFVARLYACLHDMDQTRSHFDALRNAFVSAFILLYNLNTQPNNQQLIKQILPRVTAMHDELVLIRTKHESTLAPFDDQTDANQRDRKKKNGQQPSSPKSPTLADVLLPDIAPVTQVDQLIQHAEQWLNGFAHLHHRVIAHLAAISAKVEVTVGLPPLPPVAQLAATHD